MGPGRGSPSWVVPGVRGRAHGPSSQNLVDQVLLLPASLTLLGKRRMNQTEALAPKQRDGLFDPSRIPTSPCIPSPYPFQRQHPVHYREIKSGSKFPLLLKSLPSLFSKISSRSSKKGKNTKQGCQSQASDKRNEVEASFLPLSPKSLTVRAGCHRL